MMDSVTRPEDDDSGVDNTALPPVTGKLARDLGLDADMYHGKAAKAGPNFVPRLQRHIVSKVLIIRRGEAQFAGCVALVKAEP